MIRSLSIAAPGTGQERARVSYWKRVLMLRTCWVVSLSGTVQTKRVRAPALKYLLFFSFLSGKIYNGNTLFSVYTDDPDDEEH